ncbi:hypothetical protein PybrP1_011210 [[Pythium] brassicae (nom. inval.)]|nr:hypothetical protein PybrP1_011210 [[Pythium] brassicae (nom. inval.)]
MLTPSPAAAAAAPTSATRGTSPVPSGHSSNSGQSPLDPDGYMCSACGYSVLHSHPQLLIECHYCAQWFHRACVSISERDAAQIGKYACYACSSSGKQTSSTSASASDAGLTAASSFFTAPQFSSDFSRLLNADHRGNSSSSSGRHDVALYKKNSPEFRHVLRTGYYSKAGVRVLQSQDFTSTYFRDFPSASAEPTLVEGSHWREPLPAFGVSEVAALLASSCAMRSVDVESQESFNLSATGWSARLADAATTPVNAHFRVQDTSYRSVVVPPAAVAEIDWHLALPSVAAGASPSSSPSALQQQSPACSANPDTFGSYFGAGSFQDFAVARGGRSAWLSVSDGDAWVFLVAPTPANARSFEDWTRAREPPPARTFLADRVDQCARVVVPKNATLFVPAGWMLAVYSERGCSLFAGFFSATASLSAQLRVLEAEAGERSAAPSPLAAGWPLADAAPQVWAAVCFYVRQYLVPDPSVVVSDMDKLALLHALPALRRWSATPRALLQVSDRATWVPSSLSEAHGVLDRLEQSLSNALSVSSSVGRSPFELPRYPSLPMMGHSRQPQLPLHHVSVSEAEYLYSRGSDASSDAHMAWPMGDSTGAGPPVSAFHDMPAMWSYGSPEPRGPSAAASGGFYHSAMAAGEFSSHVGANFTFSLPTQGGTGGFPVAPMAGGGGSDSYLEAMRQQLLGGALVAPSPSLLQSPHQGHHHYDAYGQPDVLVRHRASCHRCGNLRKKNVRCPQCPHIFCQKCAEKMLEEHGEHVFADGCPVCKEQCCCGKNRTVLCTRKFHCYKKCPSTKKPSY